MPLWRYTLLKMKRGREWISESYIGRLLRYVGTSCYEAPESNHPKSNEPEVDEEALRQAKVEGLLQRVHDAKGTVADLVENCDLPPAKRMKIEARPCNIPASVYFGDEKPSDSPFKLKRKSFYDKYKTDSKPSEVMPRRPQPVKQPTLNAPTQGTPECERPNAEVLALPWHFASNVNSSKPHEEADSFSANAASPRLEPTVHQQFLRPSFSASPFTGMLPTGHLNGYHESSYQQQHQYTGFSSSPYVNSASKPLPFHVAVRLPVPNTHGFSSRLHRSSMYPPGVSTVVQQKAMDLKQSGPLFSVPRFPL